MRFTRTVREVADEFDFHNGPTELYAQTHLIRRSYAGLKVLTDKGTVDEVLKQVRDLMEKLFRVISLVERNRIDWHTERVAIRSSDGSPVAKIDTYRWVSPPSEGYRPQFDVRHEGRKTLLTAFQAYANADVDDDIIISKTIDNFMIASCAKTLESKFIHWHSCLDFFKKVHQIPRMAFSKELVMMFDKCGLPLDDLLSKSAVETVRAAGKKGKAPAFTFTDLRNRYVHDGFDAFTNNYPEAIRLTRVMRALAERLLLHHMNIDYTT